MTSQPNPTEWEQETTKALNALAVECAFGVIDREDLPRLVTEALDVIRKATRDYASPNGKGYLLVEPKYRSRRKQEAYYFGFTDGVNGVLGEQREALGIKEAA